MALFRSNRGMHLLALPTTHADAENTQAAKTSRMAAPPPHPACWHRPVSCRRRRWSAARRDASSRWWEALQRQSSCPFVLIGTALDLTDSPLLRLPVQWQDTVLPDRLPEGSGRITINPGEFGMGMMQMADWGGTHTILLCLGQGLSASTELLDALNACGDYVLLCSSLEPGGTRPNRWANHGGPAALHAISGRLVRRRRRPDPAQVLPSYESERVTNSVGFNTHCDRGGMMGHHGGSGFSFGQNREVVTKPVLSQDDLTGLRNNSEFLVYNQDLMRLWVGKIG